MHFLNQVDEADLLKLMDEEEVAEFTKPVEETKPEVVDYVDDDEDYGYDPEFEDDDADSSVDEDDNEPV